MNDFIMTRRSIRKYTDAPVTDEQIKTLLRAAMSAPSAMNMRPWRFVVVRDGAMRQWIADNHPYAKMLPHAQAAIVVCGVRRQPGALKDYWVQDCSAAMENLLLQAHAMGLGAVWLGVYPRQERADMVAKALELPEDVVPLGIASLGWPAEERDLPERYDESCVHWEKW